MAAVVAYANAFALANEWKERDYATSKVAHTGWDWNVFGLPSINNPGSNHAKIEKYLGSTVQYS